MHVVIVAKDSVLINVIIASNYCSFKRNERKFVSKIYLTRFKNLLK